MFQLSRKQIQVLGWILIKPFNRRINEILRTLISQDCDQFNQNGGQIVWVVLSPNKFSKHPNKLWFVTLGEFVRQVAESLFAYFKYQGVLQLFHNKNSRTSDIQDQGLGFIVLIVTISPEIYKIY